MAANERFHTLAFTASAVQNTLAQLAMVADPMTNTQGGNLVVPEWNNVGMVYSVGALLTGVRLVAPSLQAMWNYDVGNFDVNATPRLPVRTLDLFDSPLRFVLNEQLTVQTSMSGGVASRMTVFLWLFPQRPAPVSGDIRTIKATGTTTLVANAWTNVSITLAQNLPAGRYALVGLLAQSAGILAARVAFVGGTYRPGVIGTTTLGDETYFRFGEGQLGVYGEFEHNLVPSIDVMSNSADTAETFFLDLIKIR